MSFVERPLPMTGLGPVTPAGDSTRLKGRVGAPLEEVRGRLLELAERLEITVDPHALPIIAEARRVLAEQACRIAVIGQIKAGKSSFINAFTQRADMLPTDINPWTAVVTSLHFRNDRPAPQHAAVFKMFSREEWLRLAQGGGRLRELTERLVPGFEPELLRVQVEMMRQRVELRLGPQLDLILGQTHAFETISPELLDDYVSAGTYLGAASPTERPRYSDITRTADLYFTGGPFAYPVSLIDTPGTNDPFLVRDEITRRVLEDADIYVFVISALQPLSSADVALLRILNGLHKDRIIVYVNRVDQLRNPVTDSKTVQAAVKSRLDREFPALDIPVVMGSAWWGGLSLAATERDISRLLPQGTITYLHECGLPQAVEIVPGQPLPPEYRSRIASALYVSSGIPAMASGITRMLASGSTAVLLRQLAACFLELARSTEAGPGLELQSVLGLLETRRAETRAVSERVQNERTALVQLDEPIRQIQHAFDLIERQLGDIVRLDVERLSQDLRTILDRYAAEECSALLSSLRRDDHDGQWCSDLRPLRDALERHYVASYRATEQRLMEIEHVLYPQLKTIVEAIVPEAGIEINHDYHALSNPYPSVSPLSETAVLDLDRPWWQSWFKAQPDPAVRAGELHGLIIGDFLPMTDELTAQAHGELSHRVTRTLQQAAAVSSGMLGAVQGRKAQLVADYESLAAPRDGQTEQQFEAEQSAKLERCNIRHASIASLVEELVRLQGLCQQSLNVEGGAP